jgi:membrane protease YdiL (CAAX protease family)
MYDNDSRGISYTAGFFMLICFAIAGLVLAGELSKIVWTQMTNKSITVFSDGVFTPGDSTAIKVIQSLTAIIGFFIPTLVTAAILNRNPLKLLGFATEGARLRQAGLVVLLVGTALLVASSLSHLTNFIPLPENWRMQFDNMEEKYNTQVSAIIKLNNVKDYFLALVIMAFLPAVCEETLFRGGLQNFLTRGTHLAWVSIIIVSILFSLAHFSFYGFLSRFFLGIVLGAMFHYSGKLWLSIMAHFINNALAITILYVSTQQGKPLQEAMKQDSTSFWGFLAIPAVVILFVAFKRASEPQQAA